VIVRDARGNELKEGQTVLLKWGMQTVEGVVAEVKQGGVITGLRKGGEQISPATVRIECAFTINCDPTQLMSTVYVLQQPEPEEKSKLVPLAN